MSGKMVVGTKGLYSMVSVMEKECTFVRKTIPNIMVTGNKV